MARYTRNSHEFSEAGLTEALKGVLTATGLPNPKYAIIIPIVFDTNDPELLVEVRAAGISQAGDPCFPGGRIDPGESPLEAACRELQEELGITLCADAVLGQLPTVHTILGARTNVYVGLLSKSQLETLALSPREVSRLLRVPMSFVLRDPHAGSYSTDGEVIWGMTAGAINHLCSAWGQAGLSST